MKVDAAFRISSVVLAISILSTMGCRGVEPTATESELVSDLKRSEPKRPTPTPTPTATPTPVPTSSPTPAPIGSVDWQPRSYGRMFVSGHSLTDNPLADFIGDIATKKGDSFNYNEQIILGSPIRVRTKGDNPNATGWPGYSMGYDRDGQSLNVISEFLNPRTIGTGERYDTLVITDRHDLLAVIEWENTIGYSRHYHDRFIAGNSSGRSFLYHSWLEIDRNQPSIWIDHEKKALVAWECVASKVNLTLQSDGRSDRMKTLPAGAALVDLVERAIAGQVPGITGTTPNKLNMIFSDDVHLTPLGVYYVALVTYSSAFGKTASGVVPPAGINATTASALQQIAWNYVNAYYNRSNPGVRTMSECRSFISEQVCRLLKRPCFGMRRWGGPCWNLHLT